MNYTKLASFAKSAVSWSVGLGLTTPVIYELPYFMKDKEGILNRSKAVSSRFPNPELQSHVDKHCQALGLQKVVLINDPDMKGGAITGRLPGAKDIFLITLNPNEFNLQETKGILNHELGHCYHQHSLQRTAIESFIGAMFFFKKTRIAALSAFLTLALIENTWNRFQEGQADDLSIQISDKSELEGTISAMEKVKTVYDESYYDNASHPHIEERIAKFQQALKNIYNQD